MMGVTLYNNYENSRVVNLTRDLNVVSRTHIIVTYLVHIYIHAGTYTYIHSYKIKRRYI